MVIVLDQIEDFLVNQACFILGLPWGNRMYVNCHENRREIEMIT